MTPNHTMKYRNNAMQIISCRNFHHLYWLAEALLYLIWDEYNYAFVQRKYGVQIGRVLKYYKGYIFVRTVGHPHSESYFEIIRFVCLLEYYFRYSKDIWINNLIRLHVMISAKVPMPSENPPIWKHHYASSSLKFLKYWFMEFKISKCPAHHIFHHPFHLMKILVNAPRNTTTKKNLLKWSKA